MNARKQQLGPPARRKAMLLLACLALLAAGCGREAAAPASGVADATAAVEPRAVVGAPAGQPAPEAAPETSPAAENRNDRLAERERGLTQQMLALMKRRDQVVRDQIAADSETRTPHEQMIRSRDAYQKHVAALPEVANLEQQLRLLSKQQQETHNLARKLNEEKQP